MERAPLTLFVLSDLHVDHRPNRERVPAIAKAARESGADALVIAGDVSHKIKDVEATLAAFEGFRGERLFVAGNHDIWVHDEKEGFADSREKLRALTEACARTGFHDLGAENARVRDFTFVGNIGWYDYAFAIKGAPYTEADYASKRHGDLVYQDRDYAKWGKRDGDMAQEFAQEINGRLTTARPPVVFVSHHCPRVEFLPEWGRPGWDFLRAFMGAGAIEEVLQRRRVKRFVFGHTHRPLVTYPDSGWAINNPLGYPREKLSPQLSPFNLA